MEPDDQPFNINSTFAPAHVETNRAIVEVIRHCPGDRGFGGMTMILSHVEGDSFVVLQTSVCSPKDQYDKKVGVALARVNAGARFASERRKLRYRDLREMIEILPEYFI